MLDRHARYNLNLDLRLHNAYDHASQIYRISFLFSQITLESLYNLYILHCNCQRGVSKLIELRSSEVEVVGEFKNYCNNTGKLREFCNKTGTGISTAQAAVLGLLTNTCVHIVLKDDLLNNGSNCIDWNDCCKHYAEPEFKTNPRRRNTEGVVKGILVEMSWNAICLIR